MDARRSCFAAARSRGDGRTPRSSASNLDRCAVPGRRISSPDPSASWSTASLPACGRSPTLKPSRTGTRPPSRRSPAIASSLSPALTLDAALRFESVTGRADGATTGVSWRTWLPRAVAPLGVRRYSHMSLRRRIPSIGQPAEPGSPVVRRSGRADRDRHSLAWSGSHSPRLPGPLAVIIDRVGPGTGGDPAFSRIDPDLKRPSTDEYVVGIESRRRGWLRLGLMGIARRETNLVGVVDVGVPHLQLFAPSAFPIRDTISSAPTDDQILDRVQPAAIELRPESVPPDQSRSAGRQPPTRSN